MKANLVRTEDTASDSQSATDLVKKRYAFSLTPHLEKLVHQSDAVARQFLPDVRELVITPEENFDPIGDYAYMPVTGIVHRYPDRVLLKATNACAAYCRFCFRREMVGGTGMEKPLSPQELESAIEYIASHQNIWEVILTGGDPFILSQTKLSHILDRVEKIEHVKIIRLHTRGPVSAPDRVTEQLARMFKRTKPVYVVLHVNHVDELTTEVLAAFKRLRESGVMLLSQSVLLKGVNDTVEALEALFRKLVENSVKPYYLHHPDKAPGTSHFRLGIREGQALMRQLRSRISGLCLPEYMLDIPGGFGKVPIQQAYLDMCGEGAWAVEDAAGKKHHYFD